MQTCYASGGTPSPNLPIAFTYPDLNTTLPRDGTTKVRRPKQQALNIVRVGVMERISADRIETVDSVSGIDDRRTYDRSIGLDRLETAVAATKEKLRSAIHANADVHNNLGLALTVLGRLDEAIENFEQALALKPDFREAHGGLGNALRLQGRLQEAASQYETMLALWPDDAGAHNDLAGLLMMLGRVKEAIAQYRLAIAAKPNHAETYFNLGNIFDAIGRPAEAAVAYRKALAIYPDFAWSS